MGKSRSQISLQLVTSLLAATRTGGGALFAAGSAFEAVLPVENFIASGKTMPICAVLTTEGVEDREVAGRLDEQRFILSVCGGPVTEVPVSSNAASGGSASSQHLLEGVIRDLLASLNPTRSFSFVDSTHGFQGEILFIGSEKLVPSQSSWWAVADIVLVAYNATLADT